MSIDPHLYAIALGSNRRSRHGAPRDALAAAVAAIGGTVAVSPAIDSAPLGPGGRRFANAVMMIESIESPDRLLARLKAIERDFGRRRGRRWGARTIDLDIVLWSGGIWRSPTLTVPHRAFRSRAFVLGPLVALVPGWRDPVSGLTVRQLHRRLTRLAGLPSRGRSAGWGP